MNWPQLFDRFQRQPRWQITCELAGAGLLVGLADAITGEGLDLRLLYAPLVALAAWVVDRPLALWMSLALALCWLLFVHEKFGPAPYAARYLWEAFVIFAVLYIVATLSAGWRQAARGLRETALHDSLTGLGNRQLFVEHTEAEGNRSRRTGRPLSVAFMDCDNFKSINDTRGHLTGDEVLKAIAKSLHKDTRSYDVAARLGGDEFALLLPDTSAEAARTVIKRLQKGLQKTMKAQGWPVTFSIGIATFAEPPETAEEIIRAADELMYEAKRDGTGDAKFATVAAKPGKK